MTEADVAVIVAIVFEELEDEGIFEDVSPRQINQLENQITSYVIYELDERIKEDNDKA